MCVSVCAIDQMAAAAPAAVAAQPQAANAAAAQSQQKHMTPEQYMQWLIQSNNNQPLTAQQQQYVREYQSRYNAQYAQTDPQAGTPLPTPAAPLPPFGPSLTVPHTPPPHCSSPSPQRLLTMHSNALSSRPPLPLLPRPRSSTTSL
jgi:hypothetical protein